MFQLVKITGTLFLGELSFGRLIFFIFINVNIVQVVSCWV